MKVYEEIEYVYHYNKHLLEEAQQASQSLTDFTDASIGVTATRTFEQKAQMYDLLQLQTEILKEMRQILTLLKQTKILPLD